MGDTKMDKTKWRNDAETSVEKDVSVKNIEWLATDIHEQHITAVSTCVFRANDIELGA